MRIKFFIAVSFFLLGCNNHKESGKQTDHDDFYEKCRKLALSERQIGQEYFFSRKVEGADEVSITYLGDVVATNKDTLRIVNCRYYYGQLPDAKHGSGSVYIYNAKNERIGYYNLGDASAVPSKVENASLVFRYANERCDQSTVIPLRDSIPKEIFVNCTTKGGDLYSFTAGD